MPKSLIIMIAQAKSEPWESIWNLGQIPTWINRYKESFAITNYSGMPMGRLWHQFDKFHERGRYKKSYGKLQSRADSLFVPWLRRDIPDSTLFPSSQVRELQIRTNSSYIFSGRRLIGAINWYLKETSYDFVFFTTTSSLLNLNLLQTKIEEFDTESPLYAGQVLGGSSLKFVSGAGQLLNRVAAQIVIDNFEKYPFRMLNDAALGSLLSRQGIAPYHIPWIWIDNPKKLGNYSEDSLVNTFHFRCKSSEMPRSDIKVMKDLHERLSQMTKAGIGVY